MIFAATLARSAGGGRSPHNSATLARSAGGAGGGKMIRSERKFSFLSFSIFLKHILFNTLNPKS